jgi:hypothetical protein
MVYGGGASAHYAFSFRHRLNFTERWIGGRGSVEWTPRSPDFKLMDFPLWGHSKSRVYEASVKEKKMVKLAL